MSNTAIQRRTDDMWPSGYFKKTHGASAPTGNAGAGGQGSGAFINQTGKKQ